MALQTGYIEVNVTTAAGSSPVEGAEVSIYSSDGVEETVYRFTTDRSGRIPVSALPAPDRNNSLSPSAEGPRYSRFRVTVSAEGYYTLSSPEIQVFSNIVTRQPIVLIPYTSSTVAGKENMIPECVGGYGLCVGRSDKGVYDG